MRRPLGIAWIVVPALALWLAACSPAAPPPETPLPLAWHTQLTDSISRPAVGEDLVFVVDEANQLVALDAETGARRWDADLKSASRSDDPVGVDGGRVFAAVQGDVGKVVALDAATGARQWEVAFGPHRSDEHPLAHAGKVYFEASSPDGKIASLRAADAATGATLWEFPVGSFIVTAPLVGDGLIYAGAYEFDAASNKTRRVFAVDTATGQERWSYQSDLDLADRFALDGERLYIGLDGGVVTARQAATGEAAWTARAGGRLSNSPAVAGGLVYVGTKDGEMVALNAADGVERWRLAIDSPVLTQAAVVDGVAYFGTNDGYLVAVDALAGEEQWQVQAPVRKRLAEPEIVPAMGTTSVVAGDLLLYFNGHTLNALRLE